MQDSKWKIIFTVQILLIIVIGGLISFRMGFFEDIKNDLIVDVNAETLNMNNILESNKTEKKITTESKNTTTKIISSTSKKEDAKKELVQKASLDVSEVQEVEEKRVFTKKTDDEVKKIEEKYKDKIKDSFITITTSYNSEAGQTDDTPCIAAKGMDLCKRNTEDIVATNDLPIHTKIMIPEYFGDQIFYVEDRMNERYTGTDHIDIWFKKKADSKVWGAKIVKILVIK